MSLYPATRVLCVASWTHSQSGSRYASGVGFLAMLLVDAAAFSSEHLSYKYDLPYSFFIEMLEKEIAVFLKNDDLNKETSNLCKFVSLRQSQ